MVVTVHLCNAAQKWRMLSYEVYVVPPVHAYTLICVHAYTLIWVHAYTLIWVHAYTLICVHAYTLICVHAYTLICVHAYTLILLQKVGCTAYATKTVSWALRSRTQERNDNRSMRHILSQVDLFSPWKMMMSSSLQSKGDGKASRLCC